MAMNKRQKASLGAVAPGKTYPFDDAIKIVKTATKAKFVESIDVAVRLGVDAKKSDQQVRGSTVLPAGTGKSVRVAVFCPAGAKADEALAAGADIVGMDDLAEKMQAGDLNYDVVIATPDAMGGVGKADQVLGGRGSITKQKGGTVCPNTGEDEKNAKADFDSEKLKENLQALLLDLIKAKPATAKGTYLQKVSVSSTMGPGVTVDQSSLTLK